MKEIHVFKDGSYAIVDPTANTLTVNGEEPVKILEVNPENLEKYPPIKIVGGDITY